MFFKRGLPGTFLIGVGLPAPVVLLLFYLSGCISIADRIGQTIDIIDACHRVVAVSGRALYVQGEETTLGVCHGYPVYDVLLP